MRADELLVLNYPDFSQHVQSLFQNLDTSPAFRELFLKDPASILVKVVFSGYRQPSVSQINQANRLLFSLLSNPKFIEWSKGFQERIEGQIRAISESEDPVEALKLRTTTLDRGEFYREIVRAAQEFGDFEWFYSRMVKDTEPIQSPGDFQLEARLPNDIAVCIEILIFAVAIAAVFIAVVPGIAVSREEWLSRHDLQKVSGFLAERLTARAQELRQTGALTSLDSVRKGTIL